MRSRNIPSHSILTKAAGTIATNQSVPRTDIPFKTHVLAPLICLFKQTAQQQATFHAKHGPKRNPQDHQRLLRSRTKAPNMNRTSARQVTSSRRSWRRTWANPRAPSGRRRPEENVFKSQDRAGPRAPGWLPRKNCKEMVQAEHQS